jgi:hypothetical protein
MARRRPVRDFLEWLLVDAGIAYGMRPWRVALVAATAIVAFAALFFGVLPTEFLFDQELAESVNGSGAATSGVPGLMTALHALLYSADCFFSFGIASTRPAYTSAAGLAVVAEGLLGLVVTTTFVGTVIRKFIRMG